MSTVVPIPNDELDTFVNIVAVAYPGIKLVNPEEKQKFKERLRTGLEQDPTTHLYGLYRDGKMLGGMRLFDFKMNVYGQQLLAGGVGLVAVDLLHKKEHVAKELLSFFLRHYHEQGAALTTLYPFRPDFYRKMGFGYGTKLNQYRIKPASFPRGRKDNLAYMRPDDAPQLLQCYTRYFERTHGMITRAPFLYQQLLSNPEVQVVGCRRDGEVRGYVSFGFKPAKADQFLSNDLLIHELVYEDHEALGELMTFLHSQADQINTILVNTQDETFHHLLWDPRNGSDNVVNLYHETNVQGVGIMYRVIDTLRVFEMLPEHNWGDQTCIVKLTVDDSFYPPNDRGTTIRFESGRAQVSGTETAEVEVRLGVADWSSLLMGAVSFRQLHSYGLARISDAAYIETINRIFATADKPICMTRF